MDVTEYSRTRGGVTFWHLRPRVQECSPPRAVESIPPPQLLRRQTNHLLRRQPSHLLRRQLEYPAERTLAVMLSSALLRYAMTCYAPMYYDTRVFEG